MIVTQIAITMMTTGKMDKEKSIVLTVKKNNSVLTFMIPFGSMKHRPCTWPEMSRGSPSITIPRIKYNNDDNNNNKRKWHIKNEREIISILIIN